jgi:hypothetical protein
MSDGDLTEKLALLAEYGGFEGDVAALAGAVGRSTARRTQAR